MHFSRNLFSLSSNASVPILVFRLLAAMPIITPMESRNMSTDPPERYPKSSLSTG